MTEFPVPSGLDIHYDLGQGHPLLGRRMPNLDLQTADGPTRIFTLLHDARPALLNLVNLAVSTSLRGRIESARPVLALRTHLPPSIMMAHALERSPP